MAFYAIYQHYNSGHTRALVPHFIGSQYPNGIVRSRLQRQTAVRCDDPHHYSSYRDTIHQFWDTVHQSSLAVTFMPQTMCRAVWRSAQPPGTIVKRTYDSSMVSFHHHTVKLSGHKPSIVLCGHVSTLRLSRLRRSTQPPCTPCQDDILVYRWFICHCYTRIVAPKHQFMLLSYVKMTYVDSLYIVITTAVSVHTISTVYFYCCFGVISNTTCQDDICTSMIYFRCFVAKMKYFDIDGLF